VEALKSIQQKTGILESDLQCGLQRPRHIATGKALQARGEHPSANHHPCSGEHTLLLALCLLLRAPKESYLDINHPVQQLILKTVSEMAGVRMGDMVVGSDDCSAPTFAIPLQKSAMSLARLMDPRGLSPERADACSTITRVMRNNPVMVAGTRCFDTLLMQITNGTVFAKSGSSGTMGMAILPNALGKISPALGITFKILDGSHPAVFSEKSEVDEELVAPMVATEILQQIHALNPTELEHLASFAGRPLYNSQHQEVGSYRPIFKLEKLI
jgi:L-asparaginase II